MNPRTRESVESTDGVHAVRGVIANSLLSKAFTVVHDEQRDAQLCCSNSLSYYDFYAFLDAAHPAGDSVAINEIGGRPRSRLHLMQRWLGILGMSPCAR